MKKYSNVSRKEKIRNIIIILIVLALIAATVVLACSALFKPHTHTSWNGEVEEKSVDVSTVQWSLRDTLLSVPIPRLEIFSGGEIASENTFEYYGGTFSITMTTVSNSKLQYSYTTTATTGTWMNIASGAALKPTAVGHGTRYLHFRAVSTENDATSGLPSKVVTYLLKEIPSTVTVTSNNGTVNATAKTITYGDGTTITLTKPSNAASVLYSYDGSWITYSAAFKAPTTGSGNAIKLYVRSVSGAGVHSDPITWTLKEKTFGAPTRATYSGARKQSGTTFEYYGGTFSITMAKGANSNKLQYAYTPSEVIMEGSWKDYTTGTALKPTAVGHGTRYLHFRSANTSGSVSSVVTYLLKEVPSSVTVTSNNGTVNATAKTITYGDGTTVTLTKPSNATSLEYSWNNSTWTVYSKVIATVTGSGNTTKLYTRSKNSAGIYGDVETWSFIEKAVGAPTRTAYTGARTLSGTTFEYYGGTFSITMVKGADSNKLQYSYTTTAATGTWKDITSGAAFKPTAVGHGTAYLHFRSVNTSGTASSVVTYILKEVPSAVTVTSNNGMVNATAKTITYGDGTTVTLAKPINAASVEYSFNNSTWTVYSKVIAAPATGSGNAIKLYIRSKSGAGIYGNVTIWEFTEKASGNATLIEMKGIESIDGIIYYQSNKFYAIFARPENASRMQYSLISYTEAPVWKDYEPNSKITIPLKSGKVTLSVRAGNSTAFSNVLSFILVEGSPEIPQTVSSNA